MNSIKNVLLLDAIENEKSGKDYCYSDNDKVVLREMFQSINNTLNTNICYLAELDFFTFHGSGEIIASYIERFYSESVKAFLVPQLVAQRVDDCDKILLRLYLNFKASNWYIRKKGESSNAHILARYDDAFNKIKSKRIGNDLCKLVHNHRDAYYLPFTMLRLASWKMHDLRELLITYMLNSSITAESLNLEDWEDLSYIKRQLVFSGINGLKYYPSIDTIRYLKLCLGNPNYDIVKAAKKSIGYIEKRLTLDYNT